MVSCIEQDKSRKYEWFAVIVEIAMVLLGPVMIIVLSTHASLMIRIFLILISLAHLCAEISGKICET